MGTIRRTMIIVLLGLVLLGIIAVDAQVSTKQFQFKSGASVMMGVPVDFSTLYQRANAIYVVVEHNDFQIVWKFKGTTGDTAFVFADGRIIVASTVDLNLAAKDTLTKELNDIMDMLNVVNPGLVTGDARNNALEAAIYYASEPGIFHRLKYDFKSNFDVTLMVPDCTVKEARLAVLGGDLDNWNKPSNPNQEYYIDGKIVASCSEHADTYGTETYCSVSPVDITDKIPVGLHKITSDLIQNEHTMYLEVITSSMPPKNFVLYGPNYQPWINETTKSMDLQSLQTILFSGVSISEEAEKSATNATNT